MDIPEKVEGEWMGIFGVLGRSRNRRKPKRPEGKGGLNIRAGLSGVDND